MDPVTLLDALCRGPAAPATLQALLEGPPETARAALAAEGVRIDEDARGCWRLADARGWGPAVLSWRAGVPVEVREECDSTQDEAVRRLGRLALPFAVVADHQRAGRGRRGRSWWCPPRAGLLLSLAFRSPLPPERAARGVLVWAAAIAEVLGCGVKWPNDLVDAADRKLGGMLAELREIDGEPVVVLGIGINVAQRVFPPGLPPATSLALLRGEAPDRSEVLGDVVRAVLSADVADPRALDRWRARSRTLGRRVRVAGREGVALDVREEDGALLVDGEPVLAGEVELLDGPGAR